VKSWVDSPRRHELQTACRESGGPARVEIRKIVHHGLSKNRQASNQRQLIRRADERLPAVALR
jgi:hypothetical protein